MKKKIAILGGGFSSEAEISMNSTEQLCEMMDHNLFEITPVYVLKNRWIAKVNGQELSINKADFSFIKDGESYNFDCVYNSIHGTPGEDGRLSSYFELIGMPYTNCGVFTSALTFNKYATKVFLDSYGVNSAKGVLIRKGDSVDVEKIVEYLGLPCFAKPNAGGSSFGVSKVNSAQELLPAIENALKEDNEVIVESFISGIELSNGVYEIDGKITVLPITEIQTENEFFDYEAKYNGQSREVTPANLSDEITAECKALTAKIYKALDCKGICRMDYILSNGKLFMLEINTTPGMSKASIIPQQIRAAGMNESEVFAKIINSVLNK